ncbi:hypothetical protein M3Y97_01139500 [Aphelenchoides bicaudatus]|nr:hypothetical protein M3Y97_01139500 [Aphelenchoides bicaudatus]
MRSSVMSAKGGKSNCLNKRNTCETDYDTVCYSLFNRAGVLQEKGCIKRMDLEWRSATPGSCSETQIGRYCSCKKDYCNSSIGKQSSIYLFAAFMFMLLYV